MPSAPCFTFTLGRGERVVPMFAIHTWRTSQPSAAAHAVLWRRVGCARLTLKKFSLVSEIKWNWIHFTCVLLVHYKISFLFFRFFSLIFASNFSLRFTLVIFASKRNKAKRNSSLYFFVFFRFFFVLLRFSNFCLEIFSSHKRNPQNFASIQYFSHYFASQFRFWWKKTKHFYWFSHNFRFASIFSLNFCLFYLCFRFRFLVFRIEVNHVKSGFFFASKRNEIFASISNFASKAKARAHPSAEARFPVRATMSRLVRPFFLRKFSQKQ